MKIKCKHCGSVGAGLADHKSGRFGKFCGVCGKDKNGTHILAAEKAAPEPLRTCKTCGETKAVTLFRKHSGETHGYRHTCEACYREYLKKRHAIRKAARNRAEGRDEDDDGSKKPPVIDAAADDFRPRPDRFHPALMGRHA